MRQQKSLQVDHPGVFLREELEARGWTQREFADVIGRPLQAVNEVINGRKGVTAATAKAIAAALGTSAEVWMNLQSAYDLHVADEPDPRIRARARSLKVA